MYSKLYDMYQNDKVPPVHWLPKVPVDAWQMLSEVVRTEETDKAWKLYFVDINGKELCVSVSFPLVGGVRVSGERKGFFDCESNTIEYCEDNGVRVAYTKDGLSAHLISVNALRLELRKDNRTFFKLTDNSISYGYSDGERKRVAITAPIAQGEKISGFGEKYNTLDQVGKLLPLHNDDTGYHGHTEAGEKCRSYKNVPIYHSSQGYTLFNNSFYSAAADMTADNSSALRLDFCGSLLDAFIWCGTVRENIDSYTQLTGRPILPPKWALEFWAGGKGSDWTRNGKENYAEEFKKTVDGYERMGTIPSAFYGEGAPSQHSECYDMVHNIESRMLAWNHPGVDIYIQGYNADRIREIFPGIKDEDIPMFRNAETGEIIDQGLFNIDYSHPFALELMRNKYAEFKELGLKGAMVDYGEFVEQSVLAYNGMRGDEMHNFYAYCYGKTLHDVWQENSPDDHILFIRPGCAGTQRWVGFFGGDQRGEFYGLRQAYYGGINAGLCGMTVWGSDIGSLSANDNEELYLRWLQFATFSPLMRTHGDHNAWNYSEHCEDVFKKYFWTRENLLDYVYSAAVESHHKGTPFMQMMSAYYPEDKRMLTADDQYMFGDSLMICPVLYEGVSERNAVLPQGDWIELATCKRYSGGRTVKTDAPVEVCPVFMKAGRVIPVTLPEALELASPLGEKRVKALLVALGDGETLHWESDTVSYSFTLNTNGDACVLDNKDGYAAEAVLIYGEIKEAVADGVSLDIEQKNGISAVRLPDGKWKELRIR